jgi:hypothetical protein
MVGAAETNLESQCEVTPTSITGMNLCYDVQPFECPAMQSYVHYTLRPSVSPSVRYRFIPGGLTGTMNILGVIRREERKLEKQMGKLQGQLDGLRSAAKALGNSTSKEVARAGKRVMSAAARAKISKAAKKRWAKVRSGAKKALG